MKFSASVCVVDNFNSGCVSCRTVPKLALISLYPHKTDVMLKLLSRDSSKAFKLTNNIRKLYDRHVASGNLTIRIIVPEKDIMIQKADPGLLSKFLKVLLDVASGLTPSKQILDTMNTCASELKFAKIHKVHVKRREDYPIGKPFPPDMRELIVRDLNLRSFDSRLLKFVLLRSLDLGSNKITQIPPEISQLSLNSLVLGRNAITTWPSVGLKSALAVSLRNLDLSHNPIDWLPDDFWILRNLVSINLSHLGLNGLPASFLHCLQHLRDLRLDGNKLRCLPFPITIHTQCNLSVSGNEFLNPDPSPESLQCLRVPTLFSLASIVCSRQINLDRLLLLLPWHLCLRFAVFRKCLCCRHSCGLEPLRMIFPLPRTHTLCSDCDNPPSVICYLCGPACVRTYKRKPWKYALL
ncbi:hypothetical protein CRM22_000104 [Opisthorchis felineus]|uniref:PIF1/LRR1 pleckstrin homology domain-containing protein n=2 Tax=Opisthorchis felineus TaxID=147828 RepID=A0A4S2MNL8_OPIFE|nr:hypothetical protein CRM22_000104 [Opisthorchis felineus]